MKRMVNVLFAGVLAMTVLSCGEEKKGYTLNGEISDVKDGMVYLKKYQDKSFIAVDSAVITDGTFKFEGVCTEPLAYGLTTFRDSKRPLVFFLDNEKMQLKMNESEKILTVTGSAINDLYAQNAPLTRQDGYSIDSLVSFTIHSLCLRSDPFWNRHLAKFEQCSFELFMRTIKKESKSSTS